MLDRKSGSKKIELDLNGIDTIKSRKELLSDFLRVGKLASKPIVISLRCNGRAVAFCQGKLKCKKEHLINDKQQTGLIILS